MHASRFMAICVANFVLISTTSADEPFFTGLGDLPGGYFSSGASGVSFDGKAVVGGSSSDDGHEAFCWTFADGMLGLGYLSDDYLSSSAAAVSDDGRVVVGRSASLPFHQAFRWTRADGMVGLGYLGGDDPMSEAASVSANGAVVVGTSTREGDTEEAFRWTVGEGMVGLGDLPGGGFRSAGHDVSADGGTIVGSGVHSDRGEYEAFRWTASEGMVGLGFLSEEQPRSVAYAVSGDGSVIVGSAIRAGKSEAVRWTDDNGIVSAGNLGFSDGAQAFDVSDDGTVALVGSTPYRYETFLWDTDGVRPVRDVLSKQWGLDLTGWQRVRATAISGDGRTIVGFGVNPVGDNEGWIAHIPEPSTFYFFLVCAVAAMRRDRHTLRDLGPSTQTTAVSEA